MEVSYGKGFSLTRKIFNPTVHCFQVVSTPSCASELHRGEHHQLLGHCVSQVPVQKTTHIY